MSEEPQESEEGAGGETGEKGQESEGRPEYGKLYMIAREALAANIKTRTIDSGAYARFYPLITSWRSKKPEEWALFYQKVKHYNPAERRYAKLQRATEFAEFRKSGIRDAQHTARLREYEANRAIKQAAKSERAKAEWAGIKEAEQKAVQEREALAANILDFPPALKKGSPLGHDGRLSALEIGHLKELGYDVQHYKQAIGPRQVELYLQGCILGTIEYDEMKFKAVESMRKHYMRMTKQEAEEELKQRKSADPVRLLQKWGAALGVEKFGGQHVTLRTTKKKLTLQEMEAARLQKIAEIVDRSTEDKIFEAPDYAEDKLKNQVVATKSLIPVEELKNLKMSTSAIIPAGELAAVAAMTKKEPEEE